MKIVVIAVLMIVSNLAFSDQESEILALKIKIDDVSQRIVQTQRRIVGQSDSLDMAYIQFQNNKATNNRRLTVQLGITPQIHEVELRADSVVDPTEMDRARQMQKSLLTRREELMAQLKEAAGAESTSYIEYEVQGIDLEILCNQSFIDQQDRAFNAAAAAFDQRRVATNNSLRVQLGMANPVHRVEFRGADYYDLKGVNSAKARIAELREQKMAIASHLEGTSCAAALGGNEAAL